MAEVTLENAAFQDVVKKANSAAAQKGVAFEATAGIVLENDDTGGFRIRATNTEIYYTEWMEPLMESADKFLWRVSSRLLMAVAGVLPIGANKSVVLSSASGSGSLSLKSGSIRSNLPLMSADSYPDWGVFSPDLVKPCINFAHKVALVEWAAARDGNLPPLNGIHFSGDRVIATDRYKLAMVPLDSGMPMAFTVPATVMSALVKANGSGDAQIGWDDGKFLVMPNEHTQMQLITYDKPYPKVEAILEKVGKDSLRIGKQDLIDLLVRTETMAGIDRIPKVKIWIGKEQLAAQSYLEHHDGAMIGDIIDCPGVDHRRKTYLFTPANLIASLQNAPGDQVELSYNKSKSSDPWSVASDGGYVAVVMPQNLKE